MPQYQPPKENSRTNNYWLKVVIHDRPNKEIQLLLAIEERQNTYIRYAVSIYVIEISRLDQYTCTIRKGQFVPNCKTMPLNYGSNIYFGYHPNTNNQSWELKPILL